jgi:hypothetical protein
MPTKRAQKRKPRGDTLVVCDDDDTLLRLREYLGRAGVPTRATRRLEQAWLEAESCAALVLLPDDFDMTAVTGGLCRVLSRRPCPLVILVTAVRQHLEPLLTTIEHPESVIYTAKPVWGWTILDILRNGQARET